MQLSILQIDRETARRHTSVLAARAPGRAIRFGRTWAILDDEAAARSLPATARSSETVPDDEKLCLVVQKGRLFQKEYPGARVLIDKGRHLLVRMPARQLAAVARHAAPCFRIEEVSGDRTVYEHRERAADAAAGGDPRITSALASISASRLVQHLTTLTGFGTRFSTSDGFRRAIEFCSGVLGSSGYQVTQQAITVPGHGMSANLIARLPGSSAPPRLLVTAHLDSINLAGGPAALAPGADDDGTGSAGVLEMAHVLASLGAAADVLFVLFGGEEQGLFGSKQFVAAGQGFSPGAVAGVVNMDMIGSDNTLDTPGAPQFGVLIEGAEISRTLVEKLSASAAAYTSLDVTVSFDPHDSDHFSFIEAGIPAVLTIEGEDAANHAIHSANDTMDRVKPALAVEILKMNLATILGWNAQPGIRLSQAATAKPKEKLMPTHRQCATVPVYLMNLEKHPSLRLRQGSARQRLAMSASSIVPKPRNIPVVVHILFKDDADNISDAQVHSQIDVLNKDYNMTNADLGAVPAAFKPLIGNPQITFHLAKVDQTGAPTSGITRKKVSVNAWGADDKMKSTTAGGVDAWDPNRYLNVWVCRLGDNLLGYAQFPDGGPLETDGVVITTPGFGVGGTAASPFDLGRTATHEIGHYLGLFHVFGNSAVPNCTDSDEVSDTPNQLGPNFGRPSFPTMSCPSEPNGDMFCNYMDYVDDVAMMMFSKQQVSRMQASMAVSRPNLGVDPSV